MASARVSNIQRGLIARGHILGTSGPRGNGIDGEIGPLTLEALHEELALPAPANDLGGFALSTRDEARLEGVHPDLVRIVRRAAAITPLKFTVLEGVRMLERQHALVARGASKTMNSRHLTGHAVDLAPLGEEGKVSWDWPLYHRLAAVVKEAAAAEEVRVEWGGDWKRFKDGPHWQLPWGHYPKA